MLSLVLWLQRLLAWPTGGQVWWPRVQPQQSFVLQADDFEATRHERLDQISPQLIQAKKRLQDLSEPRRQCLQELALQTELVSWLHEALGGTGARLQVFARRGSWTAGRPASGSAFQSSWGRVCLQFRVGLPQDGFWGPLQLLPLLPSPSVDAGVVVLSILVLLFLPAHSSEA